MNCWSGLRREVGEEFRDAGKWSAGLEEVVLSADFGGPFVIRDWQLGPFEELEHTLISGVSSKGEGGCGWGTSYLAACALLLCLYAPW